MWNCCGRKPSPGLDLCTISAELYLIGTGSMSGKKTGRRSSLSMCILKMNNPLFLLPFTTPGRMLKVILCLSLCLDQLRYPFCTAYWAHCLTVCLQCVCRWGFVHIYHINNSCFQATWVASWWAYIFQQGTLDFCSGVSWIFLSLIDVLSIFWWVSSCLLNPCIIQSSICCWYVSAHMASMVFVAGMCLHM